ncbi:MAG: DNA replication and repair protein RecF [Candidatus Eisenbacteria bacterium]|nr:DNA replication and repair protein RecF [Candidatus Eisenbacteria bacterium]
MRVSTLLLRDFRIHRAFDVRIGGHLLLVGPNGAGKTSILEGLHMLAVGRSFRRVPDEHLVRHGAALMEAVGDLAWSDGSHRVECRVAPAVGKRIHLDGRVVSRLGDLVEATSVVTTSVDDVLLVEGSPWHARRWLDLFACQRERGLLALMVRYAQVLRQRNALLARGRDDPKAVAPGVLEPWSAQLFELGKEIEERRIALVRAAERIVPAVYATLAGHEADVRLVYEAGIRSDTLAGLRGVLQREVARGHSLWGPHRAGLEVTLNGASARAFSSRGEKRSLAFAMKIAQGRLMRETPLCLIDDLALELDARRSAEVVRLFMEVGQVVATSARRESAWPEALEVRNLDG